MKKKMLLMICGLCVILIGCGVLAGCSKTSSKDHGLSTSNPTQITMWHYYNGGQKVAFDNLVAEFNETVGAEKGIIVNAESKGGVDDLISAVQDSVDNKVGAEDLPDMFQCYLDTAISLDKNNLFVNLNDYISAEDKANYVDNYVEEGSFGAGNAWKLFPVAKSTEVMMINKTDWDVFAKTSGYTTDDLTTWEGLVKVAESYYNWSGGKSFFGRDAFANYMIVGSMQLGTEIFKVDGDKVTIQFDEKVMRKLWDNYYVPYIKGYYNQVGRYRSDDVKLGEIIALVCSSSSASYFPSEVTTDEKGTYPIDYTVLPLPNFEGTSKYAVQQGANVGVVKSDEASEYASVVFLQWITQSEQNFKYSVESGYLPVRKDASTAQAYQDYVTTNNLQMEPIVNDTVVTALSQMENGNMYTSKGFDKGYDARTVLEKTMINLAVADREAILKEVKSGSKLDSVLKPYLTDEYFQKWYTSTKQELEEYCK